MAKNVKLLLIESVDSLGIVGDVVTVRTGYARNYLLPRNFATKPDENLIKQLAGKRAEAEKQVAQVRKHREDMTEKLKGVEIELVRACNDMGILYGAVTQQDIATALAAKGFKVSPRDVRLTAAIKRVEHADVHVKLDSDLDAIVKIHVKPDRELPKDRDGGEVASAAGIGGGEGKRRGALDMAIEETMKTSATKGGWGTGEKKTEAPAAGDKKGKKGDKGEKSDKAEKTAEPKGEKSEAKAEKPAKEAKPAKEKPAKK